MKKLNVDKEILNPNSQIQLSGYEKYFVSLDKLYKKKFLPNCILISGNKGIGKATFIYHFINRILSIKENKPYDINNFKINSENASYNLLREKIHPNFHQIDYDPLDNNIKINQIRNLIKFNNKTTYLNNLKINLIDNAENLNLNSANALLKVIEEPNSNTFFFLIHNSAKKILNTVRSRCLEFKISFNLEEKSNIFKTLMNQYSFDLQETHIDNYFHYESPGNLLKYINFFEKNNIKLTPDILNNIIFLIKHCERDKSFDSLQMLSFFIEKFYHQLCMNNSNDFLFYSNKNSLLAYKINELKKFNLNIKNTLNIITDTVLNEKR